MYEARRRCPARLGSHRKWGNEIQGGILCEITFNLNQVLQDFPSALIVTQIEPQSASAGLAVVPYAMWAPRAVGN